MKKVITVGQLRELEKQVLKGKITYSRMVESINQMAEESYKEEFRCGFSSEALKVKQAWDEYLGNDPTVCTCGNKHPLVAEFGKCGACFHEEHKDNPMVVGEQSERLYVQEILLCIFLFIAILGLLINWLG